MTKYIIILGLVIGFLLGLGAQQVRISNLKASHAKTLQGTAEKTAATAVAVNEYTNAVNTQLSVIRKSNYETTQKLQAQLTSTTAARNAYIKRLRKSATSSNSNQATNTGSSSTRESDQASFDLFLNLLDRHTRELVEVGEYADKLKAAGLMCEQSHDPLSQLHIN